MEFLLGIRYILSTFRAWAVWFSEASSTTSFYSNAVVLLSVQQSVLCNGFRAARIAWKSAIDRRMDEHLQWFTCTVHPDNVNARALLTVAPTVRNMVMLSWWENLGKSKIWAPELLLVSPACIKSSVVMWQVIWRGLGAPYLCHRDSAWCQVFPWAEVLACPVGESKIGQKQLRGFFSLS